MKIFPFRANYPDGDLIASLDSFLSNVKFQYREFSRNGFFQKTKGEGLYLYEIISSGGISHKGLIASVDLQEYFDKNIVIHEHTISGKEQQQMELILQRHAMVKPILLCFRSSNTFDRLTRQAADSCRELYRVKLDSDGSTHIFHEITEGKILSDFIAFFEKGISKAYIADGHHRTAATARLHKKHLSEPDKHPDAPSILAAFFPYDQMEVHDYNRVIEILNSISPTMVIAKLSQYLNIDLLDIARKPRNKGELTMLINKEWYSLRWRANVLERYAENEAINDYHLFNKLILKEALGINDVRTDERIKYVEGPKGISGLMERCQKNDLRIAFCLPPLLLEDMIRVADLNLTLPPKSTWFEPRIKNGLIVQELK